MMTTPRKTPRKQGLSPQRRRSSIARSPKRAPMVKPPAESSNQDGEEGITVAVRMRPLNQNEGNHKSVWKVLERYNSVAQTTKNGQPLPERVVGRSFFTFDKTFNETSSTEEVYDSVAKDIVSSVVTGLNGTIFAYGQTSSGKTYTMQGSGSIKDGTSGSGGIVHLAAADIFNNISKAQDRIFLVRASFLEIYNEEVRDLLSPKSSQTLHIREDPRRGVFVQSREEIVTDFNTLLGILFQGESNRQFASTAMNERSSRSHTIFRITIESRQKTATEDGEADGEENNENQASEDDGAVLVSTLNLVDLAGSESVRHTGATGDRQKEGGMINTSLLTLSRVIVALGAPNQTHINFRDSKLTRILQPSLSGNARMAVICCATPSELYLEETRSTLLFASRAKLVKTRAQVNEVLDDRSIIKRLQRELAEARKSAPGSSDQNKHVKDLERKADEAGNAAKEAKDKLNRLKRSILNSNVLFGGSQKRPNVMNQTVLGTLGGSLERSTVSKGKRRLSEGALGIGSNTATTPERGIISTGPHTTHKASQLDSMKPLSPSAEIKLLREALNAKNSLITDLTRNLAHSKELISGNAAELATANSSIAELQGASNTAYQEFENLSSLQEETNALFEAEKKKSSEMQTVLEQTEADRASMEEALSQMQLEKQSREEQLESEMAEMKTKYLSFQSEHDIFAAEHSELQRRFEELEKAHGETTNMLTAAQAERNQLQAIDAKNQLDVASLQSKLEESCKRTVSAVEKIAQLESQLSESVSATGVLAYQLEEYRYEHEKLKKEHTLLVADSKDELQSFTETKESLEQSNQELKTMLETKGDAVSTLSQRLETMSADLVASSSNIARLEETISAQALEHNFSLSDANAVSEELSRAKVALQTLKSSIESKQVDVEALTCQLQSVLDNTHCDNPDIICLQEKSESGGKQLEELAKTVEDIRCQQRLCSMGIRETVTTLESLEKQILQMEDHVVESETKFQELHESLVVEKDCLQTRLQTTSTDKESLALSLKVSEELVMSLQKETATLQAEKTVQLEAESKLKQLLGEGNGEKSQLSEELALLKVQLEEKQSSVLESENRIQLLIKDSQAAQSSRAVLEVSLAAAEVSITELKDSLAKEVANSEEVHSNLMTLSEDHTTVCEARDTAEKAINALEMKHKDLEVQIGDLTSTKLSLEVERDHATSELQTLRQQVSGLELALASNTKLCNDAADKTSVLEAEKGTLETRLGCLLQEKSDLATSRDVLANRVEEAQSQKESMQDELDQLLLQKENINLKLQDSLSEKTDLEAELESAVAEIETMGEKLSGFGLSASDANEKLSVALNKIAALESAKLELQAQKDSLVKELEEATADQAKSIKSLEESKSKISELQQSLSQAQETNVGASEELEEARNAREKAEATIEEIRQKQSAFDSQLEEFNCNKVALEAESGSASAEIQLLNSKVCELELAVEAAERSTNEKSNEMAALESQQELLQVELESSSLVKENLLKVQQERDEALTLLQQKEAKIVEMIAEKKNIVVTIEELQKTIALGNEALVSSSQNLKTVESEKRAVEDRLGLISQELTDTVAAKKKAESLIFAKDAAILELESNKDANTNELLQQARDAAIAADDELAEKEKELQTVRSRLTMCEEELNYLLDKAPSPVNGQLSDSVLKERYDKLDADYLLLSETLGKERTAREESEKELKRAMGEEQRLLIQEAETRMETLRTRISELEKKLTSSETDAYTAREANEKYRDEAKRLEKAATKLNREIDALKEDNQEVKRSKADFEEETSAKISKLVSSGNAIKAELYASKQTVMDLTERLRASTSIEESATRETTMWHERAADLERQLQALEEQNAILQEELQKMKSNTENTGPSSSDSDALTLKVKEMKKELASKDNRIKKLEAVRLTKDQCNALKKQKKEHGEFKEKLREVSNELRKANSELEELRANGPPTAENQSAEIQRLNFDKGLLEKKLRKYATHCQSLEDEKERIADALSSSLTEKIPDGDIISAIVSLCDQYASLQKQCDALKIQSKGHQNAFSRVKELEGIVSSLRSETEDLRQKLAKGQTSSDSESQKVAFLESENSNLLGTIKKLKSQVHNTRAELNALKIASIADSPTRTYSRQPFTSTSDENIPPRPLLGKAVKEGAAKKAPIASPSSSRKENLTVQSSSSSLSSASSTRKRRSPSTAVTKKSPRRKSHFSGRKKLRSSTRESSAPGLGEASRADSEKGPECNQS